MAKNTAVERRQKVIDVLNEARAMELQAIYQYMNQHYNLDDMDYGELAAKIKLIAIDEMRHAEMFAERIKELVGEPLGPMHGGKIPQGARQSEKCSVSMPSIEDDTIDACTTFSGASRTATVSADSISSNREANWREPGPRTPIYFAQCRGT